LQRLRLDARQRRRMGVVAGLAGESRGRIAGRPARATRHLVVPGASWAKSIIDGPQHHRLAVTLTWSACEKADLC